VNSLSTPHVGKKKRQRKGVWSELRRSRRDSRKRERGRTKHHNTDAFSYKSQEKREMFDGGAKNVRGVF
jgi:hypothetical protein